MKQLVAGPDGYYTMAYPNSASIVTDATREHERNGIEGYSLSREACPSFRSHVASVLAWHIRNGADESWEAIY